MDSFRRHLRKSRILGYVMESIVAMADRNNCVVFPRDLRDLGYDYDAARTVLKSLYRVSRGVYSVSKPAGPENVHWLRAVGALRQHPKHAASHISAAVIHGLPMFRPDLSQLHLHTNGGNRRGPHGTVHVHTGDRKHVLTDRGLAVTSIADTLVDCARTQSRETAVVMADHALHHKLVTPSEITDALKRAKFQTGAARARRVLALADGRSESVGETRARLICLDAGIAVTPQVEVRDGQGHVLTRFDLIVDGYPIGLAFDGRGKYTDYRNPDEPADQKFWEEKLQQELVEDHGYQRVPIHWALLDSPARVIARIRRAMARSLKMAG